MPRADGSLISYNPQKMALDGKLTNVPFIIGDTLDEGTLFSLGSMNITYVHVGGTAGIQLSNYMFVVPMPSSRTTFRRTGSLV